MPIKIHTNQGIVFFRASRNVKYAGLQLIFAPNCQFFDHHLCSLENINCLSKPNKVLYSHIKKDPNEDFTIKAHRPSPTTSVPQTALAPTPSFAAEIQKVELRHKPTVKVFRWRSLKTKLRLVYVKKSSKIVEQPEAATDSPAASCTSLPSFPGPPLTITVPEPLQEQQPSLESPSDRVKRVASTAINNLGRAFSSCLPLSSCTPKTPPSSPLDQNLQTSSSQQTSSVLKEPSTTKSKALLVVNSCLASLKSKGKNWRDALKNKTKKNTQPNSIFSSTTAAAFLDEMMDTMTDTIKHATGRNTKYKGPKIVKKLWKRTGRWAAGF